MIASRFGHAVASMAGLLALAFSSLTRNRGEPERVL